MYKIPYLLIKELLKTITELKMIDTDLGQDTSRFKGGLKAAPAALIRFLPMETNSLGRGQQEGELEFEIRTISDVSHGDDRRITNDLPINHYELCDKVYQAIDGQSCMITQAPGYEDTDPDQRVLGTISRISIADDTAFDRLMRTTQRFKCYVKIDANQVVYTAAVASFAVTDTEME